MKQMNEVLLATSTFHLEDFPSNWKESCHCEHFSPAIF